MRSRVFHILAVPLALVGMLVIALWARSYLVHDRLIFSAPPDSWGLISCNGLLQLKLLHATEATRWESIQGTGRWEGDGQVLQQVGPLMFGWNRGGICFEGSWFRRAPAPRFSCTYSTFRVPHAVLALVLLVPGILTLRDWILSRPRTRQNRCLE